MVGDWVDERRLSQLGPEVHLLDAEINRLGDERQEMKTQQNELTGERDKLTHASRRPTVTSSVTGELSQAEARAEDVSRRRIAYEEVLWELGFPAVETATDFEDLALKASPPLRGSAPK